MITINKTFIFLILLLINVSYSIAEEAESKPVEQLNDQAEVESVDFSTIKNPFITKLPAVQIKKTIVEQPIKKIDNTNDFKRPEPVMPREMIKPVMETTKKALPQFNLKGILWGVDHPFAVVNDTVVGLNDTINGATVKSIHRDGVDFSYMGETIHVQMDQ